MNLGEIKIQIEVGTSVSRLTLRHPEPLPHSVVATLFIDAGVAMLKRELELNHPLEEGPAQE